MIEEIQSMDKNHTWNFIDRPNDQKVLKWKWAYKVKARENEQDKPRYKARLVAKGFTQVEGDGLSKFF